MANTNWDKLTPAEKVKSAHIDMMSHREFALLSGVAMVGQVTISDKVPTAMTNGRDCWYGEKFVQSLNRKQLRYVVAHENFHKALRHCTEYVDLFKANPQHCMLAADYVVNGFIEEMDPKYTWIERPTSPPPMHDPKFAGWSFLRVYRYLMQKYPPPPQGQQGKGKGNGQQGKGTKGAGKSGEVDPNDVGNGGFDEHEMQDGEGGNQLTAEELKQANRELDDAIRQGKLVRDKMAGNEQGGADLSAAMQERDTNWKQYLRDFVTQMVKGDDMSRFVPPNKRMLASGFIMPSHFSESTGELHIYADTSGSMGWLYPILFGEVSRICVDVRPEKVRVIWWDTAVAGEQVFEPKDYDNMAQLLVPKGGGGTTPDVVSKYVQEKKLTAKCGIWLTDGDFYSSAVELPWPTLWGVYGNPEFQATFGKVVHLDIARN